MISIGLINRSAAQALREQVSESERFERGTEIERKFIKQLDDYYASPASSFHDNNIARKFYQQRVNHLKWSPYPNDGLVTFGASGTDKCDRELFFKNAKVKVEKSDDIPFRGRQRRLGSAVIEYLQLDMVHMPKRLGDVPFYVDTNDKGEYLFEDAAQERKVFEVDGVKFAITAKPDGILRYDDGVSESKLLFEYKTKASGIRSMNGKLDFKGPDDGHLRQVTAESLIFGIREGIILYESTQKPSWFSDEENKAVTKGQKTWKEGLPVEDIRAFYFYITDEMQSDLLRDLARQARLVYNGKVPKMTVDMTGKCAFCTYINHCKSLLTDEEKELLVGAELGFSKSSMAGKYDHRNLKSYLEGVADA